ncbi:BLISTER-like protein [Drosera capensis]
MASAQVLTNPNRKQDLLEAGKRRLEEYRKKKAADKAKKAASTSQNHVTDSGSDEKRYLEDEKARLSNAGDASTSNEFVHAAAEIISDVADARLSLAKELEQPTNHLQADASFSDSVSSFLSELPKSAKDEEHLSDASVSTKDRNVNYKLDSYDKVDGSVSHIGERRYMDGFLSDKSSTLYPSASLDGYSMYSNTGYFRSAGAGAKQNIGLATDSLVRSSQIPYNVDNTSQRFSSTLLQNSTDSIYSGYNPRVKSRSFEHSMPGVLDVNNDYVGSGVGNTKPSNPPDSYRTFFSGHSPVFESPSVSVDLVNGGLRNHDALSLASSEVQPRKSRPSFLDSLNIPIAPSASAAPPHEQQKDASARVLSANIIAPLHSQKPIQKIGIVEPPTGFASQNFHGNLADDTFRDPSTHDSNKEAVLALHSQSQNEDFAALEQHIEDLTQEKFSLQRAIEASRTLAESLAAENSSLTESYNQQASVVNQLKSEMESLQDEIKTQLGELESMKIQYMNAQLECSAADERAKLLAAEVIALEEKALRLRSNELKLEEELGNCSAELTSCKKKLSSLEKDRRDLHRTIDALQEEKKLMQSKMRKASKVGSPVDCNKGYPKKDVSTSTEDLNSEGFLPSTSTAEGHDATSSYLGDTTAVEEINPSGFGSSTLIIPPDQAHLIQDINTLISELMAEKEELTRALVAEISTSSTLKDINKELSHKLEVQTQRLELLTAQSMANENAPARQPTDARVVQENIPYADEGDEVVERVLGWIMKLFPGGPSRRRTSKLL